ncbi:MAG: hemerythrin domain-containing protein [Deltaproteobacteria bacterium]|nr:hemerythrin domain-containing protein [Deltaproteobacteria bacterium]
MKATDALKAEHRRILLFADVIEGLCDALERGDHPVPAQHLGWVLDFVAQYTDTVHHEKEEEVLFPRMKRAGLGPVDTLVASALEDHRTGREQVRNMHEALRWHQAGVAPAAAAFSRHARTYMYLLRHHIAVEDTVIFPKADEILSNAVQEDLAADCDALEEDRLDAGRREQLFFRLDKLAEVYAAARD